MDIERELTGGHPNSLGRTDAVAEHVLAERTRVRDLLDAWFSADEIVRLRVASAFKRVTIARPEWAMDVMDELQTDVAAIDQPSTHWILALVFDMTRDLMTPDQRQRAEAILRTNLETHDDWIVLNNTMKVLGRWAVDEEELRGWLRPHAERLAEDPRRSVARNAHELLDAIT